MLPPGMLLPLSLRAGMHMDMLEPSWKKKKRTKKREMSTVKNRVCLYKMFLWCQCALWSLLKDEFKVNNDFGRTHSQELPSVMAPSVNSELGSCLHVVYFLQYLPPAHSRIPANRLLLFLYHAQWYSHTLKECKGSKWAHTLTHAHREDERGQRLRKKIRERQWRLQLNLLAPL